MDLEREVVVGLLVLVADQGAGVDVHHGGVDVVDLGAALDELADGLLGVGGLGVRDAAEREAELAGLVLEDGLGLDVRDLGNRVVDLVDDAAAGGPGTLDVEHRRVGAAVLRVLADDVGVVDRRLGLDPADEVARALVAGGGAEAEDVEVLAVLLAEEDLDLAPVVGGDEAALLADLRGAGHVGDDARELLVGVVGEDHLDAAVVAAFELREGGAVGVAPHEGVAVGVADAAAHADRGAAEAVGVAALGALRPGLGDDGGRLVAEDVEGLDGGQAVVGGDLRDVLAAFGEESAQDLEGVARLRGAGFGPDRVGVVRVDGVHDDLVRVEAGGIELAARLLDEVRADPHEVAGAEDGLFAVGLDGEGRHRDRRLDLVRGAFEELAGE